MSNTREFFTGAGCKLAGGQWKGGHDISGHVFLLVLGSAFLWMEILPVVLRYAGLREERLVQMANGKTESAKVEVQGASDVEHEENENDERGGVSAPLAVAGLAWWMLLMTAAYFHTWFEKVYCTLAIPKLRYAASLTKDSLRVWLSLLSPSLPFTSSLVQYQL